MGYVQSVLQPNEKVVYEAKISWAMMLPGLLVVAGGVAGYAVLRLLVPYPIWANVIGLAVIAIGLAMVGWEWFERWTTEIAVTDRRIILKRGFIWRDTVEMSVEKVESVDVRQSLLGRLLDYGDIIVRGTGTGLAPMRTIGRPLEFRSHVTAH